MKNLGPMVLLGVGIIVASLFGARNGAEYGEYRSKVAAGVHSPPPEPQARLKDWFLTAGVGWGAGVLLIVAGAGLARRQIAADAASGGSGGTHVDFGEEVKKTIAEIDAMVLLIADLPMDTDHAETRDRIDQLNFDVLNRAVEARGVFMARHGLATFTDYFSPFSAGERQLARTWSAITDGHSVVARESLVNARESFTSALTAWTNAELKT